MRTGIILPHQTFTDERGSFTPVAVDYNEEQWDQFNVVTNNNPWVFRGMHYQTDPAQTKCIKVVKGEIIDFFYDLETKQVQQFHLTPDEFLYVPDTQAHGYCTLTPNTVVIYLVKGDYAPHSEHSIPWHTIQEIKDALPTDKIITSPKDS